MKKLIGLIVLVMISYCSISQTTDILIPVRRSKLIKIVKDNEIGKVCLEELPATKLSLSLATQNLQDKQDRINAKDSIIVSMQKQYSAALNNLAATDGIVTALKQEQKVNTEFISDLQKKYKGEKRKRILITVLGVLGTSAGAYFAIFR